MPVDFEADESWWERLAAAGFDASRPAVVAAPRSCALRRMACSRSAPTVGHCPSQRRRSRR
ncbi:MAG: hypothetical protein ACRDUW_07265 [Pseudonocardiaceae bacterium]